ncbi:MAG: PaaX family transcriptional regulator C-terminal domain-containing protein, partial [Actinomycetota bacterium]
DPLVADLVGQGWTAAQARFDREPSVEALWPLDDWRRRAEGLGGAIAELTPAVENGEQAVLARGFVLAAAILRLFRADPLLPDALLPEDWPGAGLRADYDRFDAAYRRLLQEFFRQDPTR